MRSFERSYNAVPNGIPGYGVHGLLPFQSRRRGADPIMVFKILTRKASIGRGASLVRHKRCQEAEGQTLYSCRKISE